MSFCVFLLLFLKENDKHSVFISFFEIYGQQLVHRIKDNEKAGQSFICILHHASPSVTDDATLM